MAIVISGVNNNDKITAIDGTIDLLSSANLTGILTAPAISSSGNITASGNVSGVNITSSNNLTAANINVGSNIQFGNAGIITATTLVGNVTGNVNHTSNLLLQISGSEKLRIANSGAFGLNGTNYGSSGQVLTSQGSGSSPTWTTISSDLVSDTSPQLGGTLDTNNQDITFNGAQNVSWDSSAADFIFNDYAKINLGTDKDFKMYQAGNNTILQSDNTSGGVYLQGALVQIGSETGEAGVKFVKDNQIELYYNNTKRFETTNTGAKVTGNLQFASAGQGIDFSASTHASGQQSELLDDYERGSWTPQFWNARTGGTQLSNPSNTQAKYVKVGRIVYLHLGVHGLTKNWAGSNTQIFIRGLPYRSYFNHNGHCIRCGYLGLLV